MGKKFGDDTETLGLISGVLKARMTKGELMPGDIDTMENDIFSKLSNRNRGVALDQFHPRIVANAARKHQVIDMHGIPQFDFSAFLPLEE